MNGKPSSTSQQQRSTPSTGWWRQTGEPFMITLIVACASSLPVAASLELIAWQVALRGFILIGWLAGLLLLPRLLKLFYNERTRLPALAALVLLAFGFSLIGGRASETFAETNSIDSQSAAMIELMQNQESYTFVAAPRISKSLFVRLLQTGNGGGPSPAAPYGEELYDIIVSYGIDPAVALAFFAHESQMGTTGVTRSQDLRNWGGQRAAYNKERHVGQVMVNGKPFVRFESWHDGVRDWCELILNRYVKRGLDTVAKAVPVYAPSSDNNVPEAYINTIHRTIAAWQGRTPPPAVSLPHVYSDLTTALLTETFLAAGVSYHPDWAFHKYAEEEAKAGRPLGSPLSESRRITVGNDQYVVQAFALDTLYTPLAPVESQTNWSDVRRLSAMFNSTAGAPILPQADTMLQATPVAPQDLQSPFQPK
jgi:Mannosyl-glycoprotein endo-beta-N-acetylglucosaminidase.